jgi:hypothetical protein
MGWNSKMTSHSVFANSAGLPTTTFLPNTKVIAAVLDADAVGRISRPCSDGGLAT